jgi:hypothetical protein
MAIPYGGDANSPEEARQFSVSISAAVTRATQCQLVARERLGDWCQDLKIRSAAQFRQKDVAKVVGARKNADDAANAFPGVRSISGELPPAFNSISDWAALNNFTTRSLATRWLKYDQGRACRAYAPAPGRKQRI